MNTETAEKLNDLKFQNKFRYFELRLVTDELDNDRFAEFLCVSIILFFNFLYEFFRKIYYLQVILLLSQEAVNIISVISYLNHA